MIRENCGIVGIYNVKDVPKILYFSLFSLQHRGQESCGIIFSDFKNTYIYKGMGLVNDVFSKFDFEKYKNFGFGIGHVRYSTTGSPDIKNIQPFIVEYKGEKYGIAHNGTLVNSYTLREELESQGTLFQTTLDTEIIIHLIFRSKKESFIDKLIEALKKVKGAYSLLIFSPDGIYAIKDPNGFRPLCLGKFENGYVVASENCAFDLIGANYIREIEEGEILHIGENGLKSYYLQKNKISRCIFEFIYFARPDSKIFGESVYKARKKLGENLARELQFKADLVIPIPDSGNIAAIGLAEKLKIPFEMGFIRNHYVGRTFIMPFQTSREIGVKVKLNPVKEVIKDKCIIVVEDSIVRGTTSTLRINELRKAGARNVYMVVSSPPIKYPCFYGIDFPTKNELIASGKTIKEIKKIIGLDGLHYLSLKGMLSSMDLPDDEFCTACFTGQYPVEISDFKGKEQFEK
ncbi:MAG: amidophosphoribosyltransferase [Candidatus Omnitrophica bacterium]|nr:amidophosphoribosyltransferase [Candidatus Omnitrophota bacterium]MCM8802116.1 amidophosphoribosyltransferase [Candidatus Omnitrophota bacterium]